MSKFTEAVKRGLEGFTHESVGPCPGCPEEHEDEEGHFSWTSCDVCDSGLAGDRFAAHARDAEGNIIHLEICVDCLQYIANGEEPGRARV